MATVTPLPRRERPRTFTSNEQFIDEIRALLWASGQTWVTLADQCHVSKTTIRRLASGHTTWPRHTTLFAVLHALKKGITVVDLV